MSLLASKLLVFSRKTLLEACILFLQRGNTRLKCHLWSLLLRLASCDLGFKRVNFLFKFCGLCLQLRLNFFYLFKALFLQSLESSDPFFLYLEALLFLLQRCLQFLLRCLRRVKQVLKLCDLVSSLVKTLLLTERISVTFKDGGLSLGHKCFEPHLRGLCFLACTISGLELFILFLKLCDFSLLAANLDL